ncbi:MAG: DAK2 domain-containing protein [Oscillospiraceae bacterium]|nr:DAK2 domain-containing protein [Oscillospiraceae bacterium]
MTERITAQLFRDMVVHAAASVDARKQDINELNVFPVPDGDTGTNMSMTLNAAAQELDRKESKSLGEAAERTASAMLRGARGNSGVITSLLFRGISRTLKEKREATAAEFAAAMNEGVSSAYKAVMKPTEGTILTVSRLASAAAVEAARKEKDLEAVLMRAELAGQEALENTQELNPVLKKAGVVDAGGVGYMEILRSFLRVLRGEANEPVRAQVSQEAGEGVSSVFAQFDTEADIRFPYCTEFIVAKENDKSVELLRSYLASIGDSAVVLDDEELIKVHVHSDRPGEVLTEALTYGSLQTVKVENMRLQHSAKLEEAQPEGKTHAAPPPAPKPEPKAPSKKLGIVSIYAGDGLADLFRELGADEIVSGGQTMNPSTEDILEAVEATGGETVLVLPNNKNIILAAQQSVGLTEQKVIVIPTTTVPQGVSAMLALDPEAEPEEIEQAMNAATGNVKSFSVTYAARDSSFDGREIHEGEYLALQDGKLLGNVPDKASLIETLSKALAETGAEFVSIFYGEDVSEEEAEEFSQAIGKSMPDAELSLVSGGQPVYYYLISAE